MTGLCLSGGGARGAYQIGVAKALEEAGILEKFDYISGTSIGAVNAVLLACLSVDEIRDIWFTISPEVLHKTENLFKKAVKENIDFLKKGLYDLSCLRKIVKNNIDFEKLRNKKVFITLSDCGVKDGGITSLIKATYLHYIRKNQHAVYSKLWEQEKNEVIQQVIASCSIPIFFPAANYKDKQYYDGGLYDNVPVKPLVEAGCDEVYVIHLDKVPYTYHKKYPNVTFHSIKSLHPLGRILKFDPKQSVKRFELGYKDCLAYLMKNNLIEKRKNLSLE